MILVALSQAQVRLASSVRDMNGCKRAHGRIADFLPFVLVLEVEVDEFAGLVLRRGAAFLLVSL